MNTKNQANENQAGVESTRPLARITPRCDIWEAQDGVHVVAEMPGVDPQSIEITLERDVLTISGRAEMARPAGRRLLYAEFEPGEFRRSFQLSSSADAEGIQANCKNGLLTVLVPRKKPASRKIAVATA
jgi:HSP20 family protein